MVLIHRLHCSNAERLRSLAWAILQLKLSLTERWKPNFQLLNSNLMQEFQQMLRPSSLLNRKHRNCILTEGPSHYLMSKLVALFDWKQRMARSLLVTKLAHIPRLVIMTSNGTLYRRNRRDIITTTDVNIGNIMSSISDSGITKSPGSDIIRIPDIIRTKSGQTVQPPRLNDFVYY